MVDIKGHGSYGAVISIPCENDLTGKKVIKLFCSNNDFIIEKQNNEIIKKIDKKRKWSVHYHGVRELDYLTLDKAIKRLGIFKILRPKPKTIKSIEYDDSGFCLNNIFKETSVYFEDIIPHLVPIFHGVTKMGKHNLVHFDITPDNILFQSNLEKSKVFNFKFIDFGTLEKTIMVLENPLISYPYFIFPLEYIIAVYYKLNKANWDEQEDIVDLVEKIQDNYESHANGYFDYLRGIIFLKRRKQLMFNIATKRYIHQLPLQSKQRSRKKEKTNDKGSDITKTIYSEDNILSKLIMFESTNNMNIPTNKIDVFGLGISIWVMYEKAIELKRIRNEKWCNENVIPLLKLMTHPFLEKRFNAIQALQRWKILVDLYKS
jgi:serine/threonine protein kinase